MTMELRLETTGREVIKPSSPAPIDHLQLSVFDLSFPVVYVPVTFFYESPTGESPEIISNRLKTSLSETLSRFYPLAGRIEGISINCNDEGVLFTEARTDVILSDFLRNFNTDSFEDFFPKIEEGESAGTWPLMRVKVSFFGSGSGFAVNIGISHMICDAASLLNFVQGWAATANDVAVTTPPFAGVTIYPPPHTYSSKDDVSVGGDKYVTNRFVFESSKIAELKRKAVSKSVPVPTRVEAITSLIWRCARNASHSNSAAPKSTLMIQAMDLRMRIPSDVLSQDAMGNLQSIFFLKKEADSAMEIGELVADFRKAKQGFNEMIEDNLQGYNSATSTITTNTLGYYLLDVMGAFTSESKMDVDLYPMSSWCKKPFYEVDLGWGVPVWMGPVMYTNPIKKSGVLMMDSKDGKDVEAWITLSEQDTQVFVRDQDLLTYAVLNPPVLI
ncbi:PREDICTED: BAHD acyltransferase At5g47980-like [Camelina sativa]|uniref:BAHD acyltransferase At5g47980-like n=1 Tax=Camelina sativa TaxID=90675 RepID=A0ABM0TPM1_CAMSA|nr:PREDICTED: BAHD acyltransferase At5g47980-like [Camelina sativa]